MCKIGFATASADNNYIVCPEQLNTFLEAMKYQNASESVFRAYNVKRCMQKLSKEDIEGIIRIAKSLLK